MRKALIGADGMVANIVEIEPDAEYTPPEGCSLVAWGKGCKIGGRWDGTAFAPPTLPPPDPTPAEIVRREAVTNPVMIAMVNREAKRLGIAPQDVVDDLAANA